MFSQFLYNASWPLVIIGLVIAVFSGISLLDALEKEATEKAGVFLGAFALGAVLIIFGWSAPEPTDGLKIVVKEKLVDKLPTQIELYNKCIDDSYKTSDPEEVRKNIELCNNISMMQSGKQMLRTVTKTVPRDRIVYKMSPWKDIYETCMGKGVVNQGAKGDHFWTVADDKIANKGSMTIRNERIKLCADIAHQETQKIVIQNERQYQTIN